MNTTQLEDRETETQIKRMSIISVTMELGLEPLIGGLSDGPIDRCALISLNPHAPLLNQ